MTSAKQIFIKLLLGWLLVSTALVTVASLSNPVQRAILGMGWGLIVLWILVCGGLMYRFRDRIRNAVLAVPLPWQAKFAILATGLALIEEAITTTMTNLAPIFGVAVGQAYITASTNYFDVIFFHSVIVFVGPFVFWALALKRYDFSPFAVFLIFGISGIFAETSIAGVQAFLAFGLWIFVYGLMIFIPAYSAPPAEERGARKPKPYHYILMVFLPVLFVPIFAWIPYAVDPGHPQPTHFQPIDTR